MEDDTPKNTYMSKPCIPRKGKDKKSFQKRGSRNNKLDEENWKEFRRNKLFFSCKEPWKLGQQCVGKGKIHYIEVVSNSDEDEELEQ